MKKILFLCIFLSNFTVANKVKFTPWRDSYISAVTKPEKLNNTCVFCDQINENNDEGNFIIKRYNHWFVAPNFHPYAKGHMLILPFKHTADLESLTAEERTELMDILCQTITVLKKVYQPEGFNVGLNLGQVAGASKPDHLHVHVVPRWKLDTGFFYTIAQTYLIPTNLEKTYLLLKPYF